MNQINPTWSTCSGINLGPHDPPRVLSKVSSMGLVTAAQPYAPGRPHQNIAEFYTSVPRPAASPDNARPAGTFGHMWYPSIHNTVHGILPKASAGLEAASAPTFKPAVFVTGLPDTTKLNSAQAADVLQWS